MKPSANDQVSPSRKAKLLHLIEETVRTWWWKDTPQQMCSRLAEYIDSSELIESACSQTGREIKRYMVHEARVRWEKDLAEWLEDQDAFNATREQRAVFWLLLELKDAERLLAAPPQVSAARPRNADSLNGQEEAMEETALNFLRAIVNSQFPERVKLMLRAKTWLERPIGGVARIMPVEAQEIIANPKATPEELERAYAMEIQVPCEGHPTGFSCAALKQGTAGGNAPADCNWPFCGCDPNADKALEAIQESGLKIVPEAGAVSAPRCPSCKRSDQMSVMVAMSGIDVDCNCGFGACCSQLEDFRQFFQPDAQPSPEVDTSKSISITYESRPSPEGGSR